MLRAIAVLSLCFLIALSLANTPRAAAGKEASACSPESLKSSLLEMSQGLRQGLGFEDSVKELAQCVEESSPGLSALDSGMVAYAARRYEDAIRLLSAGLKGLTNEEDSSFVYMLIGSCHIGWGNLFASMETRTTRYPSIALESRCMIAAQCVGHPLSSGFIAPVCLRFSEAREKRRPVATVQRPDNTRTGRISVLSFSQRRKIDKH